MPPSDLAAILEGMDANKGVSIHDPRVNLILALAPIMPELLAYVRASRALRAYVAGPQPEFDAAESALAAVLSGEERSGT